MTWVHAALLVTLAAVALPQVSVQTQTGQKTTAPRKRRRRIRRWCGCSCTPAILGIRASWPSGRESVRDLTNSCHQQEKDFGGDGREGRLGRRAGGS